MRARAAKERKQRKGNGWRVSRWQVSFATMIFGCVFAASRGLFASRARLFSSLQFGAAYLAFQPSV
jgi:hypothetical protein